MRMSSLGISTQARSEGFLANFLAQDTHTADEIASVLRSCRDYAQGKQIDEYILSHEQHKSNRFLGNLLVEMYGKCGNTSEAQKVFDVFEKPNIVSWTILMGAYTENKEIRKARWVFDQMPRKDLVVWNAMIKAYAKNGQLEEAKKIFDTMPEHDVASFNTMIAAYSQNSCIYDAKELFDKMRERNVITWNAMFAAYAQNGQCIESRKLFDRMPMRDVVSWTAIVTVYAQVGNLIEASFLFEQMPERSLLTWTVLMGAYAQFGDLQEVKRLFKQIPVRDTHACTAMISAYAQLGQVKEAQELFNLMPDPNVVTYTALVAAYAQAENVKMAKQVFDRMPRKDTTAWNAMMSAYAQNGNLEEARELFEKMPHQNTVSWSAMIAAYAQNGYLEEAVNTFQRMPNRDVVSWNTMISTHSQNGAPKRSLNIFREMDLEGYCPIETTFTLTINACAEFGGLTEGKLLHGIAREEGFHEHTIVSNSLIHMYSKCSSLTLARSVFDSMVLKTEVTWNAMMAGYARLGHSAQAMEFLWEMGLEGTAPNEITFLSVLSACVHGGIIESTCEFFEVFSFEYNVSPTVDHFTCVVDLFGRAGQLDMAEEVVGLMPCKKDAIVWITLLGACKMHGDVSRGRRIAGEAFELQPGHDATYILLSNIYFDAGGDKKLANKLVKESGLKLDRF